MLFIKNYTKGELDKSGLSMVEYYTRMIEDINIGIEEIRQYLVDMLDIVESLRKELYSIKDQVQEDLDKTKDAYEEAGYTNEGLERVQEILDGVEEEIEEIEEGIEEEIKKIDCSQPEPECDYSTECEYRACDDASCGDDVTCQFNDTPTCSLPTDPYPGEDCQHCTYGSGVDGVEPKPDCVHMGTYECEVCNHNGCQVDVSNGKPFNCYDEIPDCVYSICAHEFECGQFCNVATDGEGRTWCEFEGTAPENCSFTCAWSSSCSNQSISGCDYTCDDANCAQGCNHEMCSQCDYSSSYCGESESTCDEFPCTLPTDCDYDPEGSCNYDENTGIDYDCFQTEEEKCGDCGDCSNDCGDSCSNDCSHYDCGEGGECFYSEVCDETWGGCSEDCGDCTDSCGDDCSHYDCSESDTCFYSDECDETW